MQRDERIPQAVDVVHGIVHGVHGISPRRLVAESARSHAYCDFLTALFVAACV